MQIKRFLAEPWPRLAPACPREASPLGSAHRAVMVAKRGSDERRCTSGAMNSRVGGRLQPRVGCLIPIFPKGLHKKGWQNNVICCLIRQNHAKLHDGMVNASIYRK